VLSAIISAIKAKSYNTKGEDAGMSWVGINRINNLSEKERQRFSFSSFFGGRWLKKASWRRHSKCYQRKYYQTRCKFDSLVSSVHGIIRDRSV